MTFRACIAKNKGSIYSVLGKIFLKKMFKIKIKSFFLLSLIAVVCMAFISDEVFASEGIPQNYYKKIDLKNGIYKEVLDTNKHPEFFGIYTKYYYNGQELKFASGSTLMDYISFNFDLEKKEVVGISRGGIEDYIRKELMPIYNQEMQPVRIFRNPDNQKIEFEGMGVDGKQINEIKLAYLIKESIESDVNSIIIPFQIIPAEVNVEDEGLLNSGVKELISTGESDFSGSSWMRIQNIRVGLSRFNGVIIPKNEVFSIGYYLGEVSARTGYKRELVIKGDRTIPEYGGGLCQVSTTSFRGALQGGFEIVERWPHAYAVSYYEPYGTDATIYPPLKDLKFRNNTPGTILVQTVIDEPNNMAYFKYYGTKDERKVDILGPYISNYRSPGVTRYEVNPSLAPGQKKTLGAYHVGFDSYWLRQIKFPNDTDVESVGTGETAISTGSVVVNTQPVYDFFSRYKATSWFYQIGPEVAEAE